MESNESVFNFPCQFPIKILGRKSKGFDTTVLEIVGRHTSDIKQSSINNRLSKGGKYISITVTITARSQNQLDNIYRELSDCREVLMAL